MLRSSLETEAIVRPPSRPAGTSITASIVTHGSGDEITSCLEYLYASTHRPLEVVVFDNASCDDTLERLEAFSGRIRVVRSRENLGFGQGNNHALAGARSGFFLLLNPDVLLQPGSLDRLAYHLETHPECGAVAPLLEEGPERRLGGFEINYPGLKRIPADWPELPGTIAFLKGACVLVRGALFHELRGFDRRFFLYGEDIDFGLQIRRAGYTLECLGDVVVRHEGGHSECGRSPRLVEAQRYRALLQFYDKNYPRRTMLRLMLRDLLRFGFRWTVHRLTPGGAARHKAEGYRGRLETCASFLVSERQRLLR